MHAVTPTAPRPSPARSDFATDEARLAAVRNREPAADGVFWYSVATTGVYCRPSCAARPARRENIAFHDSCAAAERAGFRPCKRCRPTGPSQSERHAAAVAKACRLIEAADEIMPTLADLASAAGLSPHHFHRVFKATAGMTPKEYAAAHRAGKVRAELRDGASVTEAIYGAGYNSSSRFYEGADAMLGMTPTAFRQGGKGTQIRVAVRACPLGRVLIGATDRGICAISFGDDDAAMIDDLRKRFPNADIIPPDAGFDDWADGVLTLIDDPGRGLDVPLDIRGTVFQQRVWKALRDIPAGRTQSYAEVARRIGEPGAVRAVAQACASNKLAVAVPCHRVVRSDGALSGYRWGVERKRALLDREAAE